ncbi:unnamed protein product [Pieris brassicae]|uniref:Uncharacterized protein n=1 Tax=Pieris brassicae TaxID=7116 RepID=A0A9P0XCS2_PIEBR|nr:unnamed protein product [Pieris brassicae]
MCSKIVISLCLLVAITAAIPATGLGGYQGPPAPGANPWIPSWISQAPWMPQWTPCTGIGSTCLDCNTKQICTKVGGLKRPCNDPTLPYCNLGECSATPSAECAPAEAPIEAVPA